MAARGVRVERHIFGSFRGYTTLARSPGVCAEDVRRLESDIYSYGQTYDPGFYQSLTRSTPFFTTNLPGARRAMTCIGPGRPDDAGRPTLLFLSVVVSRSDWDGILLGDVAMLMNSAPLWAWSGQSELEAVDLEDTPSRAIISRGQVSRLLAVISDLERNSLLLLPTVIRESPFSFRDARAIEMLIPVAARGRFTTAFRALSPDMPANLVCLAKEADQYDEAVTIGETAAYSPYAQALTGAALASGVVPTALVQSYRW